MLARGLDMRAILGTGRARARAGPLELDRCLGAFPARGLQ